MAASHRKVWLSVALFVISFYFWCAQSGNQQFVWKSPDLGGYYDLLGRAFLGGKLYLPVEPRPELLALPNPWDTNANQVYRLHDAVLYQKHYYLYHGATPALFLFAPWHWLSGYDLPENFAVFLLCSGGYLLLCELLILVTAALPFRLPLFLFTSFLLVLGLGESLPFLLQRALVYEVAIASGFFFLSGGFLFLFKALTNLRYLSLWTALCGLFFGLAMGCRPHLGLAALPALLFLLIRPGRKRLISEALTFVLPFSVCCLALFSYNFARFGNPFEFGFLYQLGRPDYYNPHLSLLNVPAGIYYLLLSAPVLEPVFPFFRLIARPFTLPSRYFLEPVAGIISLCPLALRGLAAPLFMKSLHNEPAISATLWVMYLYSAASILFIAGLGLTSQRFEVDFEPYLLFIGCILTAVLFRFIQGFRRKCTMAVVVALIAYSIAANIAITIQGPYDQLVQAHPALYTKIARWFSPVERFRPVLNPKIHLEGQFHFPASCLPGEQPLLSLGELGSRYLLSAQCSSPGQLKLISGNPLEDRIVVQVSFRQTDINVLGIEFTPADRIMAIRWNGDVVLRHPLSFLVTARSQIDVGKDASITNTPRLESKVVVFQ